MKITIIGWYGTETIGDRAILAGLYSFFHKAYGDFEIYLGSLHPFFTERTINEDYTFYQEIMGKDIKINLFDTKNSKALLKSIKESDLLVMGGGPLMDLNELFMVEYAFKKAKKLGVKTGLLGCGVGPLFQKKFRKSVLNICKNSDIIILRDSKSKENLREIYDEFHHAFHDESVTCSYDPAVEAALEFNKLYKASEGKYISVNLREFPVEYKSNYQANSINNELEKFIFSLSEKYQDREILLTPMHYFHIGNDDRVFLNNIGLKSKNIKVQNSNLTLMETMKIYQNAYFNVGMRFHSVVLQTLLSGKNFILDYTEPKRGKISGFLADIDNENFYVKRYISLQEDDININIINDVVTKINLDNEAIIERLNIYILKLKELKK